MDKNFIVVEKPLFQYAVTENVIKNCPLSLDGKEIKSEDFIPSQARTKDSGYDVRCAETDIITLPNNERVLGVELQPGCYFKIRLGFRMLAPDGWWLNAVGRSGTFINKYIHSHYGVIDETFEGECCLLGQFIPNNCDLLSQANKYVILFGQRIAQMLVVPRYEQETKLVSNDELDSLFKQRNHSRGALGYGSSGSI